MIGSIIGAGIGLLGGIAQQSEQQYQQERLMGLQYDYNNKMAEENQRRNKEMWEYTNYSNQRLEMEKANLNPALMYGQGGGGGVSTSGGQGGPISQPTDQSVGAKAKMMEMGLQLANLQSQIKVNESVANKNNVEAEKTAGVDTESQKAGIDLIISQTTNEKEKQRLIYADTRLKEATTELQEASKTLTEEKAEETRWNVKNLQREVIKTNSEIASLGLDNALKIRTMNANVQKAVAEVQNVLADTIVKRSQNKVNIENAKAISESVAQQWQNIKINMKGQELTRDEINSKVQDVINKLELGNKDLDIKESNLIKEYVLGIGEMILKTIQ